MGGYAGLGQALCFANENQGDGTLHGHGFVALSNAYQHATLGDVVNLTQQNNSHAEQEQHVQRILSFHSHLSREDHFFNDVHQSHLEELEKESQSNFANTREHVLLGVRTADMAHSTSTPCLWEKSTISNVGDIYVEGPSTNGRLSLKPSSFSVACSITGTTNKKTAAVCPRSIAV